MEWTGVFSVGLSYCCTCLSILWLRRFGNLVSVWFLYWDIMHGGGSERNKSKLGVELRALKGITWERSTCRASGCG
jgi:hypothetical protein